MNKTTSLALGLVLLSGAACTDITTPPTPKPDLTIKVVPRADGRGYVAVPPECEPFTGSEINPTDNQPMPQFGCATARNLAAMIADPEDLVHSKQMGPSNGTTEAAAMFRYNAGKTRPFVDPTKKETTSVLNITNPGSGSDK